MVRTRTENRPTHEPASPEPAVAASSLVLPGCSLMIQSRMIKRLKFADLEHASENYGQVDYPPAGDCTIFVMPLQLPNEGASMQELRQLLQDEAVCLDRRSQQRLWSLRLDAATILTKLVQLRFAVVSSCVADDVYTWTLTAVDRDNSANDDVVALRTAKKSVSTDVDRKPPQILNGHGESHASVAHTTNKQNSGGTATIRTSTRRQPAVQSDDENDLEDDAAEISATDDDFDADYVFKAAAGKSLNPESRQKTLPNERPKRSPPVRGFTSRNIADILPDAENTRSSSVVVDEDTVENDADDQDVKNENGIGLVDEDRFRLEDEAECNYVKREGTYIFLGAPPFERRMTAYKLQMLERTFILSTKTRTPRYKAFVRHILQDTIQHDEAIMLTTTTAHDDLRFLPKPFATAIVELVRLAWKRRDRLAKTSPQRKRLVEQKKWHVSREPPLVDEVYEHMNSYFHELRTVASKQQHQQQTKATVSDNVRMQLYEAESRKASDYLGHNKIFGAEGVFERTLQQEPVFSKPPNEAEVRRKCQELYTSLFRLTDFSNNTSAGENDNVETNLRHVRLCDGYLYLGAPPFEFRISVVKFHKLKQHSLLDSKKPIFSLFTTRLLRGTIPSKIAIQYTTTKSANSPDLKVLPDAYIDAIEDIVHAVWYEMDRVVRPVRQDNNLLDPTNIWCASLDEEQPLPPTRETLRKWIYTSLGNMRLKQKQLDEEARFGGPRRNRARRTLVEILPSDDEAEEMTRVAAEMSPEANDTDEKTRSQKRRGGTYQPSDGDEEEEEENFDDERAKSSENDDEIYGEEADDVSFEGDKKKSGNKRSAVVVGRRAAGSNNNKKSRPDSRDVALIVATQLGRSAMVPVEDDADYKSDDLRVVLAGPHAVEPFEAGKKTIPPLPYPQFLEVRDGYLYLGEAPERRRLSLKKYQIVKHTVLLNAAKTPKFSIFVRRLAFATIPQSEAVFCTSSSNNKQQRSVPLRPLPQAYLSALGELVHAAWHSIRRLYIQRMRRLNAAARDAGKTAAPEKWKVPDRPMTTKELYNALSTYLKDVRDDVQAMQQKNWKRKRRPLALLEIMPSDDEQEVLAKEDGDGSSSMAPKTAPKKSNFSSNGESMELDDDKNFSQVEVDADDEDVHIFDDEDRQTTRRKGRNYAEDDDGDEDEVSSLKEFVKSKATNKTREVGRKG